MTEEELELFLNKKVMLTYHNGIIERGKLIKSPSAIRTRWKYWLENGEIVTPIFVEDISKITKE